MENNKRRRHLTVIVQLVLIVILIGAVMFRLFSGDRQGPEIALPDKDIVLTESTTGDQLLEGMTASDETDGDVTDSLKIESVTKVSNNLVLLVYAAKDTSNNVSTVTRALMTNGNFKYKGMIEAGSGEHTAVENVESANSYPSESGIAAYSEESIVQDSDSIPTDESEIADSSFEESIPQETESVVEDVESTVTEESTSSYVYDSEMSTEDNYDVARFVNIEKDPSSFSQSDIEALGERLRNANNMSISRLPDGYPVIRLNTYAISKRASEQFAALDFISDIRDDSDSASDIFGRISVTGNGDLGKTGVHTVNYYVTDSEGNRSNVAHLIVVVTK